MKDKIKVLIVDDDADDRELFSAAIKEVYEGTECVMAKDGQQALEMLRSTESSLPDFIFLDLRMPRISGKKCLLQIKADSRLSHIPVIIYTTSREEEESKELQALGAVHFMSKPSNTEEIYYMISFVLEEQLANTRKNSTG